MLKIMIIIVIIAVIILIIYRGLGFLRKTIVIVVILLLLFFLFRGISPTGANKLIDKLSFWEKKPTIENKTTIDKNTMYVKTGNNNTKTDNIVNDTYYQDGDKNTFWQKVKKFFSRSNTKSTKTTSIGTGKYSTGSIFSGNTITNTGTNISNSGDITSSGGQTIYSGKLNTGMNGVYQNASGSAIIGNNDTGSDINKSTTQTIVTTKKTSTTTKTNSNTTNTHTQTINGLSEQDIKDLNELLNNIVE